MARFQFPVRLGHHLNNTHHNNHPCLVSRHLQLERARKKIGQESNAAVDRREEKFVDPCSPPPLIVA